MHQFKNLYIIGSSHISKQSILEIEQAFKELEPKMVAVELDKQRVMALMSDQQRKPSLMDMRKVGVKGFLFALLGSWASKKLGKIVGVSPGSEMKRAVHLAGERKLKTALIDQPIEITLKRFSTFLSWRERGRIVADVFNGLVLRKKDPLLNFDLTKVPENKLIRMMLRKVKERYPNIYKVLIKERNYYMARKLKKLMQIEEGAILCIVGAGHTEGILRILKESS